MIDERLIDSMKRSGVPAEVIEKMRKRKKQVDDDFEVWEENWESFSFFLKVSRCWRIVSGMAGQEVLGLDFCQIESINRTFGVSNKRLSPKIYQDLLLIEVEALDVFSKKKKG